MQYVIGFSTLDGSHEYSQIVRKSIEDAAREHSNVELVITDNRMDPRTTLSNVEAFIQNDVDLVIEYSQDYQLGPLIAEKLSHSSRLCDKFSCSAQHASNRRAKAFRKAKGDGVNVRRYLCRRKLCRRRGVKQTRAVHVDRKAFCSGEFADGG